MQSKCALGKSFSQCSSDHGIHFIIFTTDSPLFEQTRILDTTVSQSYQSLFLWLIDWYPTFCANAYHKYLSITIIIFTTDSPLFCAKAYHKYHSMTININYHFYDSPFFVQTSIIDRYHSITIIINHHFYDWFCAFWSFYDSHIINTTVSNHYQEYQTC